MRNHEHCKDGDNGDELVPFQFVFCGKGDLGCAEGNFATKSDTMECSELGVLGGGGGLRDKGCIEHRCPRPTIPEVCG